MIKILDRKKHFWSHVKKTEYCWLWEASLNPEKYGNYWVNGKHEKAHRFAWILTFGEIPKGFCICHKCDNPSCVKPEHLFLGTKLENRKDCISKNRQAKGISHGFFTKPESRPKGINKNYKLVEHVSEIRKLYDNGQFTLMQLAKKYGVKHSSITNIVKRKVYQYL